MPILFAGHAHFAIVDNVEATTLLAFLDDRCSSFEHLDAHGLRYFGELIVAQKKRYGCNLTEYPPAQINASRFTVDEFEERDPGPLLDMHADVFIHAGFD